MVLLVDMVDSVSAQSLSYDSKRIITNQTTVSTASRLCYTGFDDAYDHSIHCIRLLFDGSRGSARTVSVRYMTVWIVSAPFTHSRAIICDMQYRQRAASWQQTA